MNKRQIKKHLKRIDKLIKNSRKNNQLISVMYQRAGKYDEYGIPHHFEIMKIPIVRIINSNSYVNDRI